MSERGASELDVVPSSGTSTRRIRGETCAVGGTTTTGVLQRSDYGQRRRAQDRAGPDRPAGADDQRRDVRRPARVHETIDHGSGAEAQRDAGGAHPGLGCFDSLPPDVDGLDSVAEHPSESPSHGEHRVHGEAVVERGQDGRHAVIVRRLDSRRIGSWPQRDQRRR